MSQSARASIVPGQRSAIGDGDSPTMGSGARTSGSFGLALTSNPPLEDKVRTALQQQKRNSTPVEDAYASLVGNNIRHVSASLGKTDDGDVPGVRDNRRDSLAGSSRDRALRASPVVAELKTNVIIKDEFTLVTDLSYHLAQRYSRPESCIMVKVDHSACLALGGGFDPCYMLHVSAVPAQLGAAANRRNAALIQAFMADILSVPAERGIVRFEAVPEECYATNGITVRGELDRADRLDRLAQTELERRRPATVVGDVPSKHRKSFSYYFTAHRSDSKLSDVGGSDAPNARPSTSHASTDYDGLRMNGISAEQLTGKTARLANGRPKTLGAEPSSISPADLIMPSPTRPTIAGAPSGSKARLSSAFSTTSVPTSKAAPPPPSAADPPIGPPRTYSYPVSKTTASLPAEIRPRNTYLDNIASLAKNFDSDASSKTNGATTGPNLDALPTLHNSISAKDPAANTARRRSTLLGSSSSSDATSNNKPTRAAASMYAGAAPTPPLPPPPTSVPPVSSGASAAATAAAAAAGNANANANARWDAKSLRSLRLGRKRSFFAAIRRPFRDDSAAAAAAVR